MAASCSATRTSILEFWDGKKQKIQSGLTTEYNRMGPKNITKILGVLRVNTHLHSRN